MTTAPADTHVHSTPPRPAGFHRVTAPGWLRVLWTTPLFFGIGAGLVVLIRWAAHWHPLWKGVPHVASQVSVALRSALDAVGLLQTPAEVYHTRSRARRLAVRGLSPEQIDAKLAERRAARDAKDFARGDALRAELEGLGVEVADTPTGTTWRVLP